LLDNAGVGTIPGTEMAIKVRGTPAALLQLAST
jgi:hypothetical protein